MKERKKVSEKNNEREVDGKEAQKRTQEWEAAPP
jgi:hypothetical protein